MKPFLVALLAGALMTSPTRAHDPMPLIPRKTLFGNPDRMNVRISPDGRRLGFAAPADGIMNIWIAPVEDIGKARPVTHDTHRGIREWYWTENGDVIYALDHD